MWISTKRLLALIQNAPNKIFEVRLFLTKSLTATHFIYTIDMISFFDEGIDGEETNIPFTEFLCNYKNKLWQIDNII